MSGPSPRSTSSKVSHRDSCSPRGDRAAVTRKVWTVCTSRRPSAWRISSIVAGLPASAHYRANYVSRPGRSQARRRSLKTIHPQGVWPVDGGLVCSVAECIIADTVSTARPRHQQTTPRECDSIPVRCLPARKDEGVERGNLPRCDRGAELCPDSRSIRSNVRDAAGVIPGQGLAGPLTELSDLFRRSFCFLGTMTDERRWQDRRGFRARRSPQFNEFGR